MALAAAMEKYKDQIENLRKQRQQSNTLGINPDTAWRSPFEDFVIVNAVAKKALDAVKAWAVDTAGGQPRGLVLFSERYGCGKTYLAQLADTFLRSVKFPNGLSGYCNFVSVANLFQELRDGYDNGGGGTDYLRLKHYTSHPLILDDLGAEYYKANEWAQQIFYRILDRMYERQSLLITTNLNPAQLSDKLGGANQSRLFGMCGANGYICMDGIPDYRAKKAQAAK